MSTAKLSINLDALATNWRNLDALSAGETAAVVKANGYGLDTGRVGQALAKAGARNFFVAVAEEGVALRRALGPDLGISVFSGHMEGDARLLQEFNLTPMLNSVDQMLRHFETLPGHSFGVQLDSGMNRLGMEPAEWAALREIALGQGPVLVMSHLACADDPTHPMNALQLKVFRDMTEGVEVPRSLSATGGILLGPDYHFDLCRPGIGLYGGRPYRDALPVVTLDLPVIQIRDVLPGESVGYGNGWIARRPSRIATVAAGYADGLIRAMGAGINAYAGENACPVVGRVSMDLITIDVTELTEDPEWLSLITPHQTIDHLADAAGTIGYEILTSLGHRFARSYTG
ncbi:alanine racemase [Parasedimentitalea psychrophila]|uniref:Alanine racemase n=1 Tax=Parasedimentitalea psychrophila TaxID=2997337 RepID=A0A9Y2KWM3_9RHOB|nr:alanine racemase [Parasedimentitalea psychrophila]WIY24028.1 alanine racemase [Parasedimentitalea psychrophila]